MKRIKRLCKSISLTLLFLMSSVGMAYSATTLKNNPVSTNPGSWGETYLTGTTFSIANDDSETGQTYFKLSDVVFGRPVATIEMASNYKEANGNWNNAASSTNPNFTIVTNPADLSYSAKEDGVNRLICQLPSSGETIFKLNVGSYKRGSDFAMSLMVEEISGNADVSLAMTVNGKSISGSTTTISKNSSSKWEPYEYSLDASNLEIEIKLVGGSNAVLAFSDLYIYGGLEAFSIMSTSTTVALGTPVTLTAFSALTQDLSAVKWEKRSNSATFSPLMDASGAQLTGASVTDVPEAGESCYRAYFLDDQGTSMYSNEVCVSSEYKCATNSAQHNLFIEDFGDLSYETDRDNGGYGGNVEYINTSIYQYVGDCKPLKAEGTYALMTNPKYAGYGFDGRGNSEEKDGVMQNPDACNNINTEELWFRDLYDHTRGGLSDGEWGAMLMVNAANLNGVSEQLVYSRKVDMPCTNTNMIFSAWFANASTKTDAKISMKFVVKDENGNRIDAAELEVKDIDFNAGWVKGETSFNSGNNTQLTVEIYNCSSGGMGNDFMVDDISFSICAPEVTLSASSTSNKVVVDTEESLVQGPCGDPVTLSLSTGMAEILFDNPQYIWYVKGAGDDDFKLKNYYDNRSAIVDTVITAGTEVYAVVTATEMDKLAYIDGQLSACAPVGISNTFTLMCMPELSIMPYNRSCNKIPLKAEITNGSVDFKWQISYDGNNWQDIDREISQDTINYFITQDSYFRIKAVDPRLSSVVSDPTEKYDYKELSLTATPNRGFYGDEIKLNVTHKNIENDNGLYFDWYKVTAGDGSDVYTNLGSTNVEVKDYILEDREAKIVVAASGCEAETIVKQIEIGVEPMDRVCNDIILMPIAILGNDEPLPYKWQRSFDGTTWEDVPASEVKAVEDENMPGTVSISITQKTMFRIAEVDASGNETGIYSNEDQIQEYEYKKLELTANPTSIEEGEDSKLTLVYENFDPTTAATWYEVTSEGDVEFSPTAFPEHEITSLTKTTDYKVVWDGCEATATVNVIQPASVAFMSRDCNEITMQATVDDTYGEFFWETSKDGIEWETLAGKENQTSINVTITETTYFRVNNALDMPSDASYANDVHSITLEVDKEEIKRDEQVTLTATADFSSNFDIKWYQNGEVIENTTNPYSPTLQTDATFYVELEGCESESVSINVIQPASVAFVSRECNEITLKATVEEGVSYKWQKSKDANTWTDMSETGSPITVTITENTKFRVKTDDVESEPTDIIELWGVILTIDKESIILGEEVTISADTDNSSEDIIWFENNEEIDNSGNSYTVKPLSGATYKVTQGGCPSNEVTLNSVVWPTVFTPMLVDGFNDDFLIGMSPAIALKIYDRYGNLIIETTDGWDGRYADGKYAMPNVYYYVATLPNGEIVKGNVELLDEKLK